MIIETKIDEQDLKKLICNHLANKLNINPKPEDITIQVKSKQNFKAEWEAADFRAHFIHSSI